MDLFLGVDAGGTRTRALLADADGAVRGYGETGTGNWQAIGAPAAGEAVRSAVLAALQGAGVEPARVRGAFFAMAGVRTAEERAVMAAQFSPLGLTSGFALGGDLEAAHAGAFAGGPGVVVIAGTGSAAWGKNAAGHSWQAGGWGWLVDDAGGGYWLAIRGLAAACEAADERGPSTVLGARAVEFFGVAGLRELLRELHAGRRDRAAVAAFASEVRAAAARGDEVAASLVHVAGEELLRLAVAVRDRVAPGAIGTGFPVAVTGGLEMGPVLAPLAERAGFAVAKPWGDPVFGSVLLAVRAGGAKLAAAARLALLAEWKNRTT